MPKKPPRDKHAFRTTTPPRSAAGLLAGIARRVGVTLTPEAPRELRERLRNCLPADLAPRLLEVRLKDQELVLFAESAAWAGRLRMAATELIAAGNAPAEVTATTRVVVRLMPKTGFRR